MVTPLMYMVRHEAQAALLQQALQGERSAINEVFIYLSSPDPARRQVMQETIHDIASPELWRHLLYCLAVWCWDDRRDSDQRVNQEASQQIDQSITEVFERDEFDSEREIKETVLNEALNHKEAEMRYAAAYLLGLRGDKNVIPALIQILSSAPKIWRVRSARALGRLGDERCAMPLIEALAADRGALHSEAKLALEHLGPSAQVAWRKALAHADRHVRWHAARALGDFSDLHSLTVLAEGLCDDSATVRWTTADALARLGGPALPAILTVIGQAPLSNPTRQATLFALHGCVTRHNRQWLKPLLDALQSPMTSGEVPPIARRLLEEWKREFGS